MTLELNEQQALNLYDWLNEEIETKYLSETTKAIMLQIIKKIEEQQ
jgi:hypothetical protein